MTLFHKMDQDINCLKEMDLQVLMIISWNSLKLRSSSRMFYSFIIWVLTSCKVFSYKHFSIKIMREIRKELISFQNLNPLIYIRFINYSFSSKKLFLNVLMVWRRMEIFLTGIFGHLLPIKRWKCILTLNKI